MSEAPQCTTVVSFLLVLLILRVEMTGNNHVKWLNSGRNSSGLNFLPEGRTECGTSEGDAFQLGCLGGAYSEKMCQSF